MAAVVRRGCRHAGEGRGVAAPGRRAGRPDRLGPRRAGRGRHRRPQSGGARPMNAPFVPAGVKVLSVGELTRQVKEVVEDTFASVWVVGEISGYKKHTSGHHYLTLKDSE